MKDKIKVPKNKEVKIKRNGVTIYQIPKTKNKLVIETKDEVEII
jgi:hypothetical protein